jgi:hypothetical protein
MARFPRHTEQHSFRLAAKAAAIHLPQRGRLKGQSQKLNRNLQFSSSKINRNLAFSLSSQSGTVVCFCSCLVAPAPEPVSSGLPCSTPNKIKPQAPGCRVKPGMTNKNHFSRKISRAFSASEGYRPLYSRLLLF